KVPGPDRICGHTLKHCAEQLGGVFHQLFLKSLASGSVPHMWKHSTIIPITKKNSPAVLNNLRPIALTPLVMKAFERIIKAHTVDITNPLLDPLQFAYRTRRGVDDAKLFLMDSIHNHLEQPKASNRLLFADFSSLSLNSHFQLTATTYSGWQTVNQLQPGLPAHSLDHRLSNTQITKQKSQSEFLERREQRRA
ncbi:hypothetical protein LDENG_00264370, partial [Lucifuga dentata]